MATKPLRFRNDPPYPGESLSSFLERTAQFYATPFNALLGQLMDAQGRGVGGWLDLDLNPSDVLQSRLADSVQDWRSPLAEHRGFHCSIMVPSLRHAYCPACFTHDLEMGRTPYFRMDWAAAFVTICWEHGTPLLEWKYRDSAGRRRLPKTWLYRERYDEVARPEFFTEQCRLLQRLNGPRLDEKGAVSTNILGYLYGLQAAVEKRSAEPMHVYPQGQDPRGDMRSIVRDLVEAVARDRSVLYDITGESYALSEEYTWFGFRTSGIPLRSKFLVTGPFRPIEAFEWRRAYLLFAARTLAGSNRYGRAVVSDPDVERPWRDLWSSSLWQGAADPWGGFLERVMARWGDHLDEPAPPGHEFDAANCRRQT